MKQALQIPTGPIHSFVALQYPLPETARERLRALSLAIHDASPEEKKAAHADLDDYIALLTSAIGVEMVRREFVCA